MGYGAFVDVSLSAYAKVPSVCPPEKKNSISPSSRTTLKACMRKRLQSERGESRVGDADLVKHFIEDHSVDVGIEPFISYLRVNR